MEPITRKEVFLAAAGGQNVDLPDPITREEVFLKAIAEGGGGSGLPDVTASDNGKVLKVVSGDWAAEDNDFVVTFTMSSDVWSSDKLYTEISDAITAKKNIYGKVAGNLITNDTSINTRTLILQLGGTAVNIGTGYSFCGTFQGSANTVFVNLVISVQPPLVNTVTAYIKETYLEPLFVEYTITGQPSGGVYPMSTDTAFTDIANAIISGREVKATFASGTDVVILPAVSKGTDYVAFSNVTFWNNNWSVFQISHSSNEQASGAIVPLSTAQMTFDSTTNTLAITE